MTRKQNKGTEDDNGPLFTEADQWGSLWWGDSNTVPMADGWQERIIPETEQQRWLCFVGSRAMEDAQWTASSGTRWREPQWDPKRPKPAELIMVDIPAQVLRESPKPKAMWWIPQKLSQAQVHRAQVSREMNRQPLAWGGWCVTSDGQQRQRSGYS